MFWFSLTLLVVLVLYRCLLSNSSSVENMRGEVGAIDWEPSPVIKKTPAISYRIAQEDIDIIARLASGDKSLTKDAIDLYRRYLDQGISPRSCAAMRFMAEVDHPCPDLRLRSFYRQEVILENPHIFH